MYLLDTNVISELQKGERCHRAVSAWYRSVGDSEKFLSVVVVGEIRQGIERVRPRDPRRAASFERWLGTLLQSFSDRIIPIDIATAQVWGRINAASPMPVIDSLLAATAIAHRLTLVTRDVSDTARSGVAAFNPFEYPVN